MFKLSLNDYGKIVIYGNGAVLLEKERDFYKIGAQDDNGKIRTTYGDDILYINLSSDPKVARKVNLMRKDNYTVKYDAGYYWHEKKTALYIHVSEVGVFPLGEFVAAEHDGEKDYLYGYKVTFNHGAEARVLKCEKLLVPGSWTIPEDEKKAGAHWSRGLGDHNNAYDTIGAEELENRNKIRVKRGLEPENYNLVHWYYENVTITENYYASEAYHKIEKDSDRVQREKLAEVMNGVLHDKLSHYDIDKLLAVVNITLK